MVAASEEMRKPSTILNMRNEFKSVQSLLAHDAKARRQSNMMNIKTFILIKNAVWRCTIPYDETCARKN